MPRDSRPLIAFLLPAGFVLFLLVTVGPFTSGKARPSELLADDAPHVPNAETVEVYELATLPPSAIARFDGRRACFRVLVDSLPFGDSDRHRFNVKVKERNDHGIVELPIGSRMGRMGDRLTVEGKVRIVRLPMRFAGGQMFPASADYVIEDAVTVKD
jgi:hypothetical protein